METPFTIKKMHRKLQKNDITIQEWWSYIANIEDKELLKSVVKHQLEVEARLKDIKNGYHFRTKIRKFCNYHGYSDVEPYEVVRIVTPKCVEIKAMKFTLVQHPTLLGIGGFSATYENYSQKWECTSDKDASIKRIRLSKKGWDKGRFRMNDNPIKFYDYNF